MLGLGRIARRDQKQRACRGDFTQLSQKWRTFFNRLVVKPLFDSKGDLVYFLGVQYDVTKQIKAQEEIDKLSARLQMSEK